MVFSSNVFLFLFLPAFLIVYYLLPFRGRSGWILVGSYALYGWWRVDFLWLLVAITVVAYWFGLVLDRQPDGSRRRWTLAVAVTLNLGALAYTLQLYFDFSGYSDMAIGLAAMMGFKFPENFNHPYISRSITEFWRRWHMSLSSWLREYLYIGLGGNRKGRGRTYLNLFLTMVLGGLWHGANWTFLLWGMWHGGLLAAERRMKEAQLWKPSPAWLTIPGTLLLVILGWVMFRADNVAGAFGMYRGMAGLNGAGLSDTLAWQVKGSELVTMLVAAVLVYAAPVWGERVGDVGSRLLRPRLAVAATTALLPLFVLAVLKLSAQSYTPFLYFQF